MNYYNDIKNILIQNENYKKVKDYSKNKSDLNSYFEVGRLLIKAQDGEERAKYGNQLIKEYSERLTKELGKGYTSSALKRIRKFYLIIKKGAPLAHQLSWSHYQELLPLNDLRKITYYIKICINYNLSRNNLREKIKSKEYERIGYKEEIEEPKVNTLIKNPIVIKTNTSKEKISEYTLHQLIIEDMDSFLKELGIGFLYYGHEVKIENNNSIDFLLFNYEFNCFVVIEMKITKLKAEYIGQIKKYMNYIDKNIKKSFHDKTVGVIICKHEDKFILEYCSDDKIFTTTYKIKT